MYTLTFTAATLCCPNIAKIKTATSKYMRLSYIVCDVYVKFNYVQLMLSGKISQSKYHPDNTQTISGYYYDLSGS